MRGREDAVVAGDFDRLEEGRERRSGEGQGEAQVGAVGTAQADTGSVYPFAVEADVEAEVFEVGVGQLGDHGGDDHLPTRFVDFGEDTLNHVELLIGGGDDHRVGGRRRRSHEAAGSLLGLISARLQNVADRLVSKVRLQVLQLENPGAQIRRFGDRLRADQNASTTQREVKTGTGDGVVEQALQIGFVGIGGKHANGCRTNIGADHHRLIEDLGRPLDEILQGGIVEFDPFGGAGVGSVGDQTDEAEQDDRKEHTEEELPFAQHGITCRSRGIHRPEPAGLHGDHDP